MRRAGASVVCAGLMAVLLFGLFPPGVVADEPGWGIAAPVDTPPNVSVLGGVSYPRIAMDSRGNAMAVWFEEHYPGGDIRASRYTPGTGWAPAATLSSPTSTPLARPAEMAMDPVTGDATAVWANPSGVWSDRYDVVTGWGPPELVWTGSSPLEVKVAMDSNNRALAVWLQEGIAQGATVNLSAAAWSPTGGWGTAEVIGTGDIQGFDLSMNAAGRAIAVWVEMVPSGSSTYVLQASRYVPSLGWNRTAPVATATLLGYVWIVAESAIDDAGNAFTIWAQEYAPYSWADIRASHYDPAVGWSAPAVISPSTESGDSPQVAFDASGNAIATWRELSGNSIRANRYVAGVGWGAPTIIDQRLGNSLTSEPPQLAVDSGGNATVTWGAFLTPELQRGGGREADAMANRYQVGSGWGNATLLETSLGGTPGSPVVAMDATGNALTIWVHYQYPRASLWWNRFAAGMGWGRGSFVERRTGPEAYAPDFGMDSAGDGLAVWYQGDGTYYRIWAKRFRPALGWEPSTTIDPGGVDAFDPKVAMSASGPATAVWTQWDGTRQGIWAAGYVPNVGWSTPTPIDTGPGNAFAPQVVVDDQGDAVAIWIRLVAAGEEIWANRYRAGVGWSSSSQITPAGSESPLIRLAGDSQGNATAVWTAFEGAPVRVWATRYTVGVGWTIPEAVSSPTETDYATESDAAMDAMGNAIVVWTAQNAVWAARYFVGSGWAEPVRIGTNIMAGSLSEATPRIAISSRGDALVVWNRFIGDYDRAPAGLWANRYVPAAGWEGPRQIGTNGYFPPAVAVNAVGNAIVLWEPCCPSGLFEAVRYGVGVGWVGPVSVGPGAGYAGAEIALDPSGGAVAIWEMRFGTRTGIWTNRYVPDNRRPSLSITTTARSLTNDPVVTISGTTDPTATVTVDYIRVPVDTTGTFTYTVTLPDGPHTFLVAASDPSGNVNTASLTITVDTTPPALSLRTPIDGTETKESTTTVSGTAEPGAIVVANGLYVAVRADGTFSFQVPLSEGPNAISVAATDAAGNTANAIVHVTYVRTDSGVPNDLGQTKGLVVALVVLQGIFAALVGALFVLYRRARGKEPELAKPPGPSEPDGDQPQVSAPPTRPKRNAIENRWKNGGPVKLTTKERVLLHLLSYAKYADAAEVPSDLTLLGISESAGVDTRHFAQYTRPLVRDGLVRERTAHVKGVVQRRKVYVLTEEGRAKASGVRERLKTATVRARDASGVREASIAEILARVRGATVLDVVRAANHEGVVDLEDGSG